MERINKFKYLSKKHLGHVFSGSELYNKSILSLVPMVKNMDRIQLAEILYQADLKLIDHDLLEKTFIYRLFDSQNTDILSHYKRLPFDQMVVMLFESIALEGGFSSVSELINEAMLIDYNPVRYLMDDLNSLFSKQKQVIELAGDFFDNVDSLNLLIERSINQMVCNKVLNSVDLELHSKCYLSKGVLNQDLILQYSVDINGCVLKFMVDVDYDFPKMKLLSINVALLN